MNKGDKIYYARILPPVGIYEVWDLKVRAIYDTWFSATEKRTHMAFIFSYSDENVLFFKNRADALEKVLEAEKHKKVISTEKYYEEY